MSVTADTPVSADPARTEKVAALFELALLLEQHPEIPIPFELSRAGHLSINFLHGGTDDELRDQLLETARAIPGTARKRVWGGEELAYYTLDCKVGSINIELTAYRDAVCQRIVTGTREVIEEVPDPAVVVPTVTVTKTVEEVEWRCEPLNRAAVEA